jgi:hypothetical protein
MAVINSTTNDDKNMGGKEHSTLLMEMWISATTMESSMEVPQKTENRTTMWSSDTILEHTSKGMCSRIW